VIGWTYPEGSRPWLGALLLAYYDPDNRLHDAPVAVAVSADGSKVYVASFYSGSVSVIDTARNTVTATIPVYGVPDGVAGEPGWQQGLCHV
jgi:YVTN family beta-propeller protein